MNKRNDNSIPAKYPTDKLMIAPSHFPKNKNNFSILLTVIEHHPCTKVEGQNGAPKVSTDSLKNESNKTCNSSNAAADDHDCDDDDFDDEDSDNDGNDEVMINVILVAMMLMLRHANHHN